MGGRKRGRTIGSLTSGLPARRPYVAVTGFVFIWQLAFTVDPPSPKRPLLFAPVLPPAVVGLWSVIYRSL
jgi:hypothetical protein